MVRAGARPDETTWILLLSGHVKLGAADPALGAFKSVRNVGGEAAHGVLHSTAAAVAGHGSASVVNWPVLTHQRQPHHNPKPHHPNP